MALPSVISTLVDPWHGVGGPYVSSGGNVYVLTRSAGAGELHMFKSSDPATSGWANAGTDVAMTSGNTIRHIGAYQVADLIHVVTRDAAGTSSNQIRYHVFDMSTDTWTTTNTLVKTTYTQKGTVDESPVRIIVRGDGNKIVFYEGPQVLADIQRARTYYARHMGSAWSADIALDNGGNVDWYPQDMVLGSADRVHFCMLDRTSFALYQRCLTSANALQSFPAAFENVPDQSDVALQRAIAYSASAGGTVVRFPYFANFLPEINDARFSSVDAPTPPFDLSIDITTPQDNLISGIRNVCSLAADGNAVYNVFINTSQDLYVQSSQDAAAWSSPTLVQAANANYVFTNCFVRSNSRVVGIVYLEGTTDLTYTEYTLSTAAASATLFPRMGLLGVGR